jgi:hypothetical protein
MEPITQKRSISDESSLGNVAEKAPSETARVQDDDGSLLEEMTKLWEKDWADL